MPRDNPSQKKSDEVGIESGINMTSSSSDSSTHKENEVLTGTRMLGSEPEELSAESVAVDDGSSITSFRDIESDCNTAIKTSSGEFHSVDTMLHGYSETNLQLFRQFNRESPNLYETSAEDDSLLLDCENFINFELDQNKIIVLNIKDAMEHSHAILKQHSITYPRSTDLPGCLFINNL